VLWAALAAAVIAVLPAGASATPSRAGKLIVNGDFETGSLAGWKPKGTTGIASSGCHGGTSCAMLGLPTATRGDSSITQQFRVPAGANLTLSFWWETICDDQPIYDWATAMLTDMTSGKKVRILPKSCPDRDAWRQVSVPVLAGHRYGLRLTNRDDGVPYDPTYSLFDDVTVQ
jgi:hypothetical protein